MKSITYKVEVDGNGDTFWYLGDTLHRENGPAVEYADGDKTWYLNGEQLSEQAFLAATTKVVSCAGKIVTVDGKRYKLVEAS